MRVYRDPGYLADAFTHLVAALDAARQVCADGDPLIASAIEWLHAVSAVAGTLDVSNASAIRIGIAAYLGALGIPQAAPSTELPRIVWYDAGRLLALSGVPEEV